MPKVIWYGRKPHDLGNFSIENAFRELLPHFENGPWQIEWREAGWHSTGWLNRLRIVWEARKLDADIIHITGDIHFAAWMLGGKKVVMTVHDLGFLQDEKAWRRWVLRKWWLDWPVKRCNRLVAVSQATRDQILAQTPFPESALRVIPTVIPSHFHPRSATPENPKPVLLHIGLAENKNLRGHAEAISGMDVRLRIIGEPSESDCAMLDRLNIDYEWMSRLSDQEMQEAYATSDMLLFCSTLEGFGMPILEAKTVGLPVITSDLSPMREVGAEYAIMVDPFDVSSIARAVKRVLSGEFPPPVPSPSHSAGAANQYAELYRELCLESMRS